MKDLVIIGGKAPEHLQVRRDRYRRIIAADSGYDTACRLSITPDEVVGDFDSTDRADELIAMGYEPCPRDKDDTDAAIAIRRSSGIYDLIGGGEGRIDHTLSLLAAFRTIAPPSIWYMLSDTLVSVSGCISFTAPRGTDVSIIPLDEAAVTTDGLKWDMGNVILSGTFISQSNRVERESVCIEAASTVFLRFFPSDFPSVRFFDGKEAALCL